MESMKEMKKLAKELLENKNILIGYELEDGELEGHHRQVLIRPVTTEDFKEIWEHGKKYCSKMTIYLISNDLFVERRPDMLNYIVNDDPMYFGDIIEGAIEINKDTQQSLGEDLFESSIIHSKMMLSDRIQWILKHLIAVNDLGNNCYNIVYAE